MSVMKPADIWVVAELENGELMGVTYELLAKAAELAAKINKQCAAVLIGAEAGDKPVQLIAAGADKVYCVENAAYEDYDTEVYAAILSQLVEQYQPGTLMLGATANGMDLAPRLSARFRVGLCADCIAADIEEDGTIAWTRPALGGNLLATIVCQQGSLQMATVRPKVFVPREADPGRKGEIIAFTPADIAPSRVEIVKKTALTGGNSLKIEDAEVLCSGGRGMGSAAEFALLEELAGLFEAGAVSGSRAVVDEGWLPHSQQVGQSGKTVKPKLYLACGISGAMQHLAGMKESGCIVAINKDAMAPIFGVASYGVVGDLHKVLPELIAKIKAYKA